MYRGTTPTLRFKLPFAVNTLAVAYVSFKQKETVRLEKTLAEATVDGDTLEYKLTQSETLKFSADSMVDIQVRVRTNDGTALASKIITLPVKKIIKGGVI